MNLDLDRIDQAVLALRYPVQPPHREIEQYDDRAVHLLQNRTN